MVYWVMYTKVTNIYIYEIIITINGGVLMKYN